MIQMLAIARNTFKEAIRNRILYIILIFALILIGFSGVLSELSIQEQMKVIKNLGFMSINFFSMAIAVFVGVSLVYNELEKKSIYTIVSKPITRGQFLIGKYVGLLATVFVNVLLMTFFFLIAVHYYTGRASASEEGTFLTVFASSIGRAFVDLFAWGKFEATLGVMPVILTTCIELMIITAFSVLYSSFSTPTLSMIFTVLTFIAGRLNEDIIRFSEQIFRQAVKNSVAMSQPLDPPFSYYATQVAAYLVPNLGAFSDAVKQAIYGDKLTTVGPELIAYGLLYTAGILGLSILIFMRRNFK